MLLAINYSPAAAELVSQGKIKLDRFKCPPWDWMVAEARQYLPVAVHFNLKAGSGRLSETNWGEIEAYLEQTGTPYINLHIEPEAKYYPALDPNHPDPEQSRQVIDNLLADIQVTVDHFGAGRVIVENAPYHPEDLRYVRTGMEPAIIRRVIEETGCYFLLDIAHACITARALGYERQAYFAGLPLERTRELHFTGIHTLEGRWVDHLSILPQDWETLRWALEQVRGGFWGAPKMLAFEYGGVGGFFGQNTDPAVIAEQVPRLYDWVHPI